MTARVLARDCELCWLEPKQWCDCIRGSSSAPARQAELASAVRAAKLEVVARLERSTEPAPSRATYSSAYKALRKKLDALKNDCDECPDPEGDARETRRG